ncbi:MAG: endonuclease domain-containing protein [Candidatus Binatia bacterium]
MGGMNTTKARELRKNPTEAERQLWQHLRLRQFEGYKFRRQQPLGPYVVDFVCLEQKLIIEVDGGQHSTQVPYDQKRSIWLETHGFRVLRFWNNEVLKEVEMVKEAIWKALRESHPHLHPPPSRGRRKARIPSPVRGKVRTEGCL